MLSMSLVYCFTLVCSCIFVQTPARPEWSFLSKQSSVIVVGVVEETFRVMPKPKTQPTTKRSSDGTTITDLPSQEELAGIGRIYRLRVEEIIKRGGIAKQAGRIDIYVHGMIPFEGSPMLSRKKRYLIFLDHLKADSTTFKDATMSQFDKPSTLRTPFNPTSTYTIFMNDNGIVRIERKTRHIVDEVKASLNITQ